jgi:hypothetical protein
VAEAAGQVQALLAAQARAAALESELEAARHQVEEARRQAEAVRTRAEGAEVRAAWKAALAGVHRTGVAPTTSNPDFLLPTAVCGLSRHV